MENPKLTSEYTHIEHQLNTIEKKIDTLNSGFDALKSDIKKLSDLGDGLKEDVSKIETSVNNFFFKCAELEEYLKKTSTFQNWNLSY